MRLKIRGLNERVGSTIQMIRVENRLTQAEFAKRLGVNERSVRRWETGKGYPTWTALEKMEKEFNCTFNVFTRNLKAKEE